MKSIENLIEYNFFIAALKDLIILSLIIWSCMASFEPVKIL